MKPVFSLLVGLLFGVGLCLSGMTLPTKVIGFLDVAGAWDPSLAFVMAGAIGVGFFAFRRARDRVGAPSHRLDGGLVAGSLLFGVGWGLVGYCPGPALTAIASLEPQALAFAAAMVFGTVLHRLVGALRDRIAGLRIDDRRPVEANACG